MDPKAVTQQMDEATKALKSSFTESSTKLFGSVMDAKRGLFSGITSKFDQVANIVGGTGSATGASEQTKNAEAGGEPGNATDSGISDESASTKPRPPKPPAPVVRQRSEADCDRRGPAASVSTSGSSRVGYSRQNTVPSGYGGRMSVSGQIETTSGGDNATAEGGTAEGGTAASVPSTGGRTFVDGKPPPFRRRNTNPFMEGYDPNVVENEIPPPNVTGNDGTVTAVSESGNATTVTADGAPVAPTGQHSVEPSRAWDMAANAMHAVTDLLPSLPKIPSGGPSAFFSPSTRTAAADQQGPPPPSKPRKKRTEDGGESDADSDATEGCDDRGEDEDLGEGGVVADRSEAASRNSINSNDPDDLTQLDAATKDSMNFMKYFVDKIFTQGEEVTAADKSKFGELCQKGTGRLWFAKYVNSQRVNSKAVPEPVILNLVQHIAVVLFECNEAEDYGPAKTLMNMAFTYYHEVQETKTAQETANIFNKLKSLVGQGKRKTYLYSYLKDQAIWQSPRFWNAAFFFAMQHERANKPATSTWSAALSNIPIQKLEQNDEVRQQENLTVSQLRTFTCNMRALGVPKDHCLEFIRRQASLANLPSAQVKLLRENMEQWTEESANK